MIEVLSQPVLLVPARVGVVPPLELRLVMHRVLHRLLRRVVRGRIIGTTGRGEEESSSQQPAASGEEQSQSTRSFDNRLPATSAYWFLASGF